LPIPSFLKKEAKKAGAVLPFGKIFPEKILRKNEKTSLKF